jgi:hypothetical protein
MNQARCAHITPVPSKKEETAADEQKNHKYTVPNAITMARIVATPYIGWLIFEQQFDAALLGARCARSAPPLPSCPPPSHTHTRTQLTRAATLLYRYCRRVRAGGGERLAGRLHRQTL